MLSCLMDAWVSLEQSCIRYGEDSQTRRLGSVGGPVSVQSTLSQRSVNATVNAAEMLAGP